MKDTQRMIREFLAQTKCQRCNSGGCRLHYLPRTKLCPQIEQDIKNYVEQP